MASCAKNKRTKNYYNWISLLQVTIDNVRSVFSGHGAILLVLQCIWASSSEIVLLLCCDVLLLNHKYSRGVACTVTSNCVVVVFAGCTLKKTIHYRILQVTYFFLVVYFET